MHHYSHLDLILPCHSLEDFPTHLVGEFAEGILANWTARWHPVILAATGEPPHWTTMGEFTARKDTIFLLPSCCQDEVQYEFPERGVAALEEQCQNAGAILLPDRLHRENLAAEIIEKLIPPVDAVATDDELIRDFYALGYWHLQIEILTRQMRYACHLDESQFFAQAVEAARMACKGEKQLAHANLQKCFTQLAEERNHYYPVDSYLLELSMIAPTSSSKAIVSDLVSGRKMNIWCSGATTNRLREEQPNLTKQIAASLKDKRTQLVGCELTESPISLQSAESHLADLRRGIEAYKTTFDQRPVVYFRRRFGLNPALPMHLTLTGWQYALHATLDAGNFSKLPQSRTSWEGFNIIAITAFGQIPLDASRPETFLKLSLSMGESMERDYVAAICLAHWSGQASHWIEDVQRGAKFGLGIGTFALFEEFFASTEFSSQVHSPGIDSYRAPFLKQAVLAAEADPISRHVRSWQEAQSDRRRNTLMTWGAVLGAQRESVAGIWSEQGGGRLVAERLAPRSESSTSGRLLMNLENQPQRDAITGQRVPPCGFLWLDDSLGPGVEQPKIVNVEEATLENEFMRVQIDRDSGAIRAVYDQVTRGNRLAQRLVHAKSGSTDMQCDSYEVVRNDQVAGIVQTKGRLRLPPTEADQECQKLARFEQSVMLRRTSRVIELTVRIHSEVEYSALPWRDYFAIRWAWADPEADLVRTVLDCPFPTSGNRFESPLMIQINEARRRTTIIPNGIPYHHQHNERMLDTLLQVQGERCQTYHLWVAIDAPNPQIIANGWSGVTDSGTSSSESSSPRFGLDGNHHLVEVRSNRPANNCGSLFSIDSKHILTSGWEPIWSEAARGRAEKEDSAASEGCIGFRVRLRETAGKSGRIKLTAPRKLISATKCDLWGTPMQFAEVDEGAAVITMSANEWTEVECRW